VGLVERTRQLNRPAYSKVELKDKVEYVNKLLPQVFDWARSANPTQPLTSGLWSGTWSTPDQLNPTEHIQVEQSDVISFHNYSWPEDFEQKVVWLQSYLRPVLCTEYMARSVGSTFDTILPIAKKHNIAAINWGFVAGKTQTYLPWDLSGRQTLPRAGDADHSRINREAGTTADSGGRRNPSDLATLDPLPGP